MTIQPGARLGALLCLAAVGLGACDHARDRAMRADPGICVDFRNAKAATPGVAPDGPAAVDDCVQRWAYSLAPSRDGAETVAAAVVAACTPQLTRWNQQAVAQPAAPAEEGASLVTGEPTTPLGEHYTFTTSRALLYVVQARAGRCAAPAAKDGAPEGIR